MKKALCALTASAVLSLTMAVAIPVEAQTAGTARVTVVHGIRGRVLDVYLDGALALKGFQPDRLTDVLTLPAGHHQVDLREPNTSPTSTPFTSGSVDLPVGSEGSVVAHLAADGKP